MNSTTSGCAEPREKNQMRENTEQLAWRILLLFFGIFCLICVLSLWGAYWFFFVSTVPLNVQLQVARGTVSLISPGSAEPIAVTNPHYLDEGGEVATDATSQALLLFSDPYTGRTVATMTLFNDTIATVVRARRPRFDFSSGRFTVTVETEQGHIGVRLPSGNPRATEFELESRHGRSTLRRPGDYIAQVLQSGMNVTVIGGEAAISTDGTPVTISDGQRATVTEGHDDVTLSRSETSIVTNPQFEEHPPDAPSEAVGWECYDRYDAPDDPRSSWAREVVDGRAVFHLWREGENLNHAEVGCTQDLGEENVGIDVSGYGSLEMRATMMISGHSLSTCGILGSECPIMVVMYYRDMIGADRWWIHGFYSYYDPMFSSWPFRCSTCSLEHERINPNVWYTFESGNLINLIPAEQRPRFILRVKFYASGHAYDVMLDEFSVLVGP